MYLATAYCICTIYNILNLKPMATQLLKGITAKLSQKMDLDDPYFTPYNSVFFSIYISKH